MLIFIFYVFSCLNADRINNQVSLNIEEDQGTIISHLSGRFDEHGGMNDIRPLSQYTEQHNLYCYVGGQFNVDISPTKSINQWYLSRKVHDSAAYDLNHDGFDDSLILATSTAVNEDGELVLSEYQRIILLAPPVVLSPQGSGYFHAQAKLSVIDLNADTYLDVVASDTPSNRSLYLYTMINPGYLSSNYYELFQYFKGFKQTLQFNQNISVWGFSQIASLNSAMKLLVFLENELQVFRFSDNYEFTFEEKTSLPEYLRNIHQFQPFRKHPNFQDTIFDFALICSSSDNSPQLYLSQYNNIANSIPVINEVFSGYTLEEFYVPEMFDKKIAVYYTRDDSNDGLLVLYSLRYDIAREQFELISDFEYPCNTKPINVSYQTSVYPSETYQSKANTQISPAFWSLDFEDEIICLFYE